MSDKEKMSTPEAVAKLVRKDTVKISSGVDVEVRLCKVRDIEAFVTFIASVFDELEVKDVSITDREAVETLMRSRMNDPAFLLKLISKKADAVFDIVARFTSLSVQDIKELDLDDAADVMRKVVEINYDFFTKRVLPVLQETFAGRTVRK